MATRLTQASVRAAQDDHPPGTQLYDEEVSGLRLIVGKRGCSYKLVGRINDGTGRYISVVIGRTDDVSLRTARERATELRLALRRGEDSRRPRTSVPDLATVMDRYLASRPDLSHRTREWYRQKIDGPLKSLARLPADRVDRETVRSLHERLTRQRGPYAANGAMRVLKLLLNDAARTHDLPPNPVTRAVRMNKEEARDWAVGPGEMPDLWRALDGMDDRVRRACWLTMLTTGLRSTNARSIRWEHLDDDGVLTVPRTKAGRRLLLPLPRLLVQELEAVRDETTPLESPFVFASPSSKSGHVEQMRRTDGFPYAPHQMRHTYRTHALEAGVDFQSVTMLMDHANPHVSFNYVTRAHLTGHLRECQEAVCARLASYRD